MPNLQLPWSLPACHKSFSLLFFTCPSPWWTDHLFKKATSEFFPSGLSHLLHCEFLMAGTMSCSPLCSRPHHRDCDTLALVEGIAQESSFGLEASLSPKGGPSSALCASETELSCYVRRLLHRHIEQGEAGKLGTQKPRARHPRQLSMPDPGLPPTPSCVQAPFSVAFQLLGTRG